MSGSWTDDAKLKLDDDAVVGLIVARNASQNRVLYAVTQQGLYVHDDANTRFVETDFKVPKIQGMVLEQQHGEVVFTTHQKWVYIK